MVGRDSHNPKLLPKKAIFFQKDLLKIMNMVDLYYLDLLRKEQQDERKDAWEPVPLYLELEIPQTYIQPKNQEQEEDPPGFVEIYL